MLARLILATLLLLAACSGKSDLKKQIPTLLNAIECDRTSVEQSRLLNTEARDRQNYQPVRFEVVTVKMRQPTMGYHGPTKGHYVLTVEQYPSEQAARKRAEEYVIAEWTKRVSPGEDRGEATWISKTSVRCWGISAGKHAYLLTTHSSYFSTLEGRSDSIRSKLTTHLHTGDSTPRTSGN